MNRIIAKQINHSIIEEFIKKIRELELIFYASEAANEMNFKNTTEFHEAVKRAMELCLNVGLPLEGNFMQIYKSSKEGLVYDWKISPLAYHLVCLNGECYNPKVARMQVDLVTNLFFTSKNRIRI